MSSEAIRPGEPPEQPKEPEQRRTITVEEGRRMERLEEYADPNWVLPILSGTDPFELRCLQYALAERLGRRKFVGGKPLFEIQWDGQCIFRRKLGQTMGWAEFAFPWDEEICRAFVHLAAEFLPGVGETLPLIRTSKLPPLTEETLERFLSQTSTALQGLLSAIPFVGRRLAGVEERKLAAKEELEERRMEQWREANRRQVRVFLDALRPHMPALLKAVHREMERRLRVKDILLEDAAMILSLRTLSVQRAVATPLLLGIGGRACRLILLRSQKEQVMECQMQFEEEGTHRRETYFAKSGEIVSFPSDSPLAGLTIDCTGEFPVLHFRERARCRVLRGALNAEDFSFREVLFTCDQGQGSLEEGIREGKPRPPEEGTEKAE